MFWTRFKSVLVFVPLMLIMIFIGGAAFQLFMAAVLLMAAWEYWHLLTIMGFRPSLFVILGGLLILMAQRVFFGFQYTDLVFAGIYFLVALYCLLSYERGFTNAIINFALHLSVILYLGWIGSYFFTIRSLGGGTAGKWWMLSLIAVVWLVDLGAYTFGILWGKHKMCPRLSPKKSWEGYFGGIIFGIVAGILLSLTLQKPLPDFSLWQGAILGLALGLLTPIGDLFISVLKRTAGVKDTGSLIPGHGGVLDRIDSWIWAAMIGYYLILLLGKI